MESHGGSRIDLENPADTTALRKSLTGDDYGILPGNERMCEEPEMDSASGSIQHVSPQRLRPRGLSDSSKTASVTGMKPLRKSSKGTSSPTLRQHVMDQQLAENLKKTIGRVRGSSLGGHGGSPNSLISPLQPINASTSNYVLSSDSMASECSMGRGPANLGEDAQRTSLPINSNFKTESSIRLETSLPSHHSSATNLAHQNLPWSHDSVEAYSTASHRGSPSGSSASILQTKGSPHTDGRRTPENLFQPRNVGPVLNLGVSALAEPNDSTSTTNLTEGSGSGSIPSIPELLTTQVQLISHRMD
ncbi:hypothetical protein BC829DRAFT_98647 [Chytridium lagenaria]|nr:hypothetical protein BC829DRAFT_98647 [Chytridium lagenaria]